MSPYTVALIDAPSASVRQRIEAEVSFASELERQFGGAQMVARAFTAWCAQDCTADATRSALAARWHESALSARRVALAGLAGSTLPRFIIQVGAEPFRDALPVSVAATA